MSFPDSGLARAVRPEETRNVTWVDRETQVINRGDGAETLGEVLHGNHGSKVTVSVRSP